MQEWAGCSLACNHSRQSAQIRAQLNLITILSGLVCHRKLGEICCELQSDRRSCVPKVPCSCSAQLRSIFKLPSWHYHLINPHTPTHTHRCAHPHTVDVCVHVQRPVRRSSASPMPLYGCMTHRPACPTRVDFHSWSSLLKHVLHPPSPPLSPPLASIPSCHVLCLQRATLRLTYTVHAHMHQTPAYLKEPVLFLHLRHRIWMSLWSLGPRCPYSK